MAADWSDSEENREFISSWPPEEPETCEMERRKRKFAEESFEDDKRPKERCKNVNNLLQIQRGTCSFQLQDSSASLRDKHFPMASSALAKWWKESERLLTNLKRPESSNPNTILLWVSRLPEAKEFMMDQTKRLQKQIPANPSCAGIHLALGSYYSKMRDYAKALEYLNNAEKLDPGNKDISWLKVKVTKDQLLQEQTQKCKNSFALDKTDELKMPEPLKVERRHHASLNAKEFLFQYALTDTPIIITGLVEHMTINPWTMQHIKKVIGHKTVPLKKRVKESSEWAKLEHACSMKLDTFITSLHSSHEPLYLFDWSLPTFAPELAKELTIPRYFAGDFLQRTAGGSLYHDTWPSLFIAPAGLTSDLHVDAFGSNFWMALFEGRKRWTFFSKEDLPLLYPHCDEASLNVSFDVDLSKPDLKDFPLLSKTTPRQCTLEAGELMFVPHGSPHFVENLEDSLAVSGNYVDLSNQRDVVEELKEMEITDPQAGALREQLASKDFPKKMWSKQNDLSWEQFKQWPPSNYDAFDIDFHNEIYQKYGFENNNSSK